MTTQLPPPPGPFGGSAPPEGHSGERSGEHPGQRPLVGELPTRSGDGRSIGRRVRDWIFGTERRLGLWILPLFLIMGLLGATLAGGLAVLYYGQQVRDLGETTARARAGLDEVGQELRSTAEQAREQIEEQVRSVRETLAQDPPIATPAEGGVYAVAARHPGGEVRVGSGFTIFSDASETFLVTTYRLVQTDDGFATRTADVYLHDRTVTAAVHNYDRDLDVATLRLRGGPLPVLDWRPGDETLSRGDVVWLSGIAGPGTATMLQGAVAGVSGSAIVPSLPMNSFVAGGPLLDASGRVLAIASLHYAPFGPLDGDLRYAVPIRAICRRIVRCTRADLAADELADEGGTGAVPRTSPQDSPSPSPEPTQPPPPPPPSPEPSPPEQSAPE